LSIFAAETIGTAILVLLGNGVVACVLLNQSKGQNSGWIVITFGWGMAVMAGVFAVGQFSGAHLNPAVTLGQAITGGIEWSDVPKYLAGEFVGAFIGATLVWLAYFDHWGDTEDPGLKLACYSTAPAIRNPVMNVLTEVIGTFLLVFGILASSLTRRPRPPGWVDSSSACSSSASAFRWVARPATPSTRRETSVHASCTRFFRSRGRARRTGATRGSLSSVRSSGERSRRSCSTRFPRLIRVAPRSRERWERNTRDGAAQAAGTARPQLE